jgi:hypothetical protein
MSTVNAMDLVSPEELYKFVQGLLNDHGDTPEKLMILLIKIATAKAILEDALELDEPITAVLEKDE